MRKNKNLMFSPSILSADPAGLMSDIRKVAAAQYLHVDVMDGRFVPEITIGPGVLKAINYHVKKEGLKTRMDAHLMVENPERQIEKFILAGADIVTVHAEATNHLHRLLNKIRSMDTMAGVALNPATPLSTVEEVIHDIDLLLIMSVNPGYGGQSFIPGILAKMERAANLLEKEKSKAILEIDGGVNLNNIKAIADAGAELIVAGSAIFKDDPAKNLEALEKAAAGDAVE